MLGECRGWVGGVVRRARRLLNLEKCRRDFAELVDTYAKTLTAESPAPMANRSRKALADVLTSLAELPSSHCSS